VLGLKIGHLLGRDIVFLGKSLQRSRYVLNFKFSALQKEDVANGGYALAVFVNSRIVSASLAAADYRYLGHDRREFFLSRS